MLWRPILHWFLKLGSLKRPLELWLVNRTEYVACYFTWIVDLFERRTRPVFIFCVVYTRCWVISIGRATKLCFNRLFQYYSRALTQLYKCRALAHKDQLCYRNAILDSKIIHQNKFIYGKFKFMNESWVQLLWSSGGKVLESYNGYVYGDNVSCSNKSTGPSVKLFGIISVSSKKKNE